MYTMSQQNHVVSDDFSHTTADNRRRIFSETLRRPDFPTIFYSSITRGPRGVAKKKKGEISKLGVHARMVARRRRGGARGRVY